MTLPRSDAFVFFGATGDLAHKKIFPALQALIRRGHLDVPIIGVALPDWSLEQFQARARDSLEQHGGVDARAFDKLQSLLRYVSGDYSDPQTFARLQTMLGTARRPLYYLAIPPSLFGAVARQLADSGGADGARVVVEKPFGHDLASARTLNSTLHQYFPEEAIFRIDHYLGKEPVQNLTYFRFANPLIEAGWSNRYIDSVQITMAESFGVAGRGRFYDETGAIRDVIQNHLLEVIACLGMECPMSHDHEARRDARGKLLKAVRSLEPADVVRGQFRGYRGVEGVAADSQVETYAAVRFQIDNERWAGVPFYVRAGKCLPVTATEVLVRLKAPLRNGLDDLGPLPGNHYRFQLGPRVVIALQAKVKKAGERMEGECIELIAHHQAPDEMGPYERLLGDALEGDATLFAREDSVEESWRIIDPALKAGTPLYDYEPATWGPPQAGVSLTPPEGWHNPEPQEIPA
jgi:glucose-6-phosphate 1-dehydrogenase